MTPTHEVSSDKSTNLGKVFWLKWWFSPYEKSLSDLFVDAPSLHPDVNDEVRQMKMDNSPYSITFIKRSEEC